MSQVREFAQRVIAGRYTVRGELGRGGMGVVWLAEDTTIGRQVAVKELHLPDGVPPDERRVFEERVLREARTAGRLNDPAVVTVYDVVQEAGATYIVMEVIQAPTLTDVVRQHGPLPPAQVAKVAEQLLSALEAAHQAGIVHRDVKPSNIMLAPNGRSKLTDFGIAQTLDDPRLTTTGILIGSPSYMAPERLRGEDAGPASDLWALGAVLFFAAEGYSPHEKPTTAATMHSIISERPLPTRAQGVLASIISGLMAPKEVRLTAPQVRGLLAYAAGPQTGPLPVPPPTMRVPAPKRKRGPLVATAAAVLLVAGLVGGYLLNSAVNREPEKAPIAKYTYGENADIADFDIYDGSCGRGQLQPGASYGSTSTCEESFTIQVFGRVTPGESGTSYAYSRAGLEGLGEAYCGWLFGTEHVPADKRGNLVYSVVLPSQSTWKGDGDDSGKREIFCVLSAKNGNQLTGSQVATKD